MYPYPRVAIISDGATIRVRESTTLQERRSRSNIVDVKDAAERPKLQQTGFFSRTE
jgi:hypothetical protein